MFSGQARPLSGKSNRAKDFAVFILYSRSWLIFNLTVLSQNVFLLLRIAKSENEEINDRLEDTLWCTFKWCEIMPTQRECVCCREKREAENKMEGRILSLYCIEFQLRPNPVQSSNMNRGGEGGGGAGREAWKGKAICWNCGSLLSPFFAPLDLAHHRNSSFAVIQEIPSFRRQEVKCKYK